MAPGRRVRANGRRRHPACRRHLGATRYAAELLRWDDRVGTYRRGRFADIMPSTAIPPHDIAVLKNVCLVMKDGKIYKN
jgi:imidazolonepropionase-like amidohydrolase